MGRNGSQVLMLPIYILVNIKISCPIDISIVCLFGYVAILTHQNQPKRQRPILKAVPTLYRKREKLVAQHLILNFTIRKEKAMII
jgi:hypothetical protein